MDSTKTLAVTTTLCGEPIVPEEMHQWIKDLRSGEFKQGTDGYLRRTTESDTAYCCLGVLCTQIPQFSFDHLMYEYPTTIRGSRGWINKINEDVKNRTGISLSMANDSKKYTFEDIADVLDLVYVLGIYDNSEEVTSEDK